MTEPRIPLTVIGGYLGAGKTTLVNRILTGDHGRRLAVIVNDFGDVAIDEALLGPADGGVRALANGCVCCSAVDGLAVALGEIATLDPPPEHLIIEVSGVGDPWAVAQWGRTPRYELDGVVVVVDPVAVRRWVDDPYVGDTVRRQIAAADLVLVSHADDEPDACAETAEWVTGLTRGPVLIGTNVSLPLLLGGSSADAVPGGRAVSRETSHAEHAAASFVPRAMSRADLREWLERAPEPVVRAKGFVASAGGMVVGQRFGHRVEVVGADRPVEPHMTLVCRGPVVTADVRRWCADASDAADVTVD